MAQPVGGAQHCRAAAAAAAQFLGRPRRWAAAVLWVLAAPAWADCRALTDAYLDSVHALQAVPVAATASLPAYCRVRGRILPDTHFELRLPEDWSGRFLMAGCGGFCGTVEADREGHSNGINVALRRGYAAITMDSGHHGAGIGDATWAYGNRQAELDYAGRSMAHAARVGKELATLYYGEPPRRSYFSGCSNGGRLGAIAAQRYPQLFDGIASGCPVLDMSRAAAVFGAWNLVALDRGDGTPTLTSDRIAALAATVLEACDALDGATDDLIADPRRCDFDPASLACPSGADGADCLSPAKVETVRRWYDGPRNSAGEPLFPGIPRGSERFWPFWWLGAEGRPALAPALALGYLRYVGFEQDPGPAYKAQDFDFDRDPPRLAYMGRLIDALDPDLSRFEARGGKLLMYHGFSDALVVPGPTIAYYESVLRAMGGGERVGKFFRLFMVPGMGHCWELPGGHDQFDPLAALEDWVERGIAPDRIMARRGAPGQGDARPLCPYPEAAVPAATSRTAGPPDFTCR